MAIFGTNASCGSSWAAKLFRLFSSCRSWISMCFRFFSRCSADTAQQKRRMDQVRKSWTTQNATINSVLTTIPIVPYIQKRIHSSKVLTAYFYYSRSSFLMHPVERKRLTPNLRQRRTWEYNVRMGFATDTKLFSCCSLLIQNYPQAPSEYMSSVVRSLV